jgi:hypothetical protein
MTLKSVIIQFLEAACDHLRQELQKVGQKFFVTHDNEGTIEVYADIMLKAYVPKKYDGWDVELNEWDGEDITYDLDQELSG